MTTFSPELVQIMRMVLDDVMARIPADHATTSVKAYMAEYILKAAAQGETTYVNLLAAATEQIKAAMTLLT